MGGLYPVTILIMRPRPVRHYRISDVDRYTIPPVFSREIQITMKRLKENGKAPDDHCVRSEFIKAISKNAFD